MEGVLASLRFFFAQKRVDECNRDISTVEKASSCLSLLRAKALVVLRVVARLGATSESNKLIAFSARSIAEVTEASAEKQISTN